MSYRTALHALAAHENPHLTPLDTQQELDRLQESTNKLQNRQEQLQQQLKQLQADKQQDQQVQQQHRQQEADRVKQKLAAVQQKLQADLAQLAPLQQQHQQWEALRGVLLYDLVDSKYHLVVSSQNFGVFASKESSRNMKAAWLVHSIHTLRHNHPTLKVRTPFVHGGTFSCWPVLLALGCPFFSDLCRVDLRCIVGGVQGCCDNGGCGFSRCSNFAVSCCARLQVAYIDKQLLASTSVPGRKLDLFRNASVLLASTHQQKLAAAAGLPQQQEACRWECLFSDDAVSLLAVDAMHVILLMSCRYKPHVIGINHPACLPARPPACLPTCLQGPAAVEL